MKKFLMGLFLKQPVIAHGVGMVLGVAAARGLPVDSPEIKDGLTALVLAVGGLLIHQTVVSPATAVNMAKTAAVRTAEELGPRTVGPVGSITDVALDTVNTVLKETTHGVGGVAGGLLRGGAGLVKGLLGRG